MRDITVAIRDPALYYLQFILVLFFGFLVGAVFMNTKYAIDNDLSSNSGGLLWVVFMMAYMQIFKVGQYLMISSSIALLNTPLYIVLYCTEYFMIWSVMRCYDESFLWVCWIILSSAALSYVMLCHILHYILLACVILLLNSWPLLHIRSITYAATASDTCTRGRTTRTQLQRHSALTWLPLQSVCSPTYPV